MTFVYKISLPSIFPSYLKTPIEYFNCEKSKNYLIISWENNFKSVANFIQWRTKTSFGPQKFKIYRLYMPTPLHTPPKFNYIENHFNFNTKEEKARNRIDLLTQLGRNRIRAGALQFMVSCILPACMCI